MTYIVTPVVTKPEFNYQPIRADNLNEPGRITSQIITLLMEADLVIADLTTNNANVYYELCLRHAIGKPVIHMAVEGTTLSFDIRDNRTIFYTMHSRTAEAARAELEEQIRHVNQHSYKPMNPILETAGIISLERSAVPEEKAIGQLMAMISQMDNSLRAMQQSVSNMPSRSSPPSPSTLAALAQDLPTRLDLASLSAGALPPSFLASQKTLKNLSALVEAGKSAVKAQEALSKLNKDRKNE